MATVAEEMTLDEHVNTIVAAAIASERKRTANLLLERAEHRHRMCGRGDALVTEFTMLANELLDPSR